MDTSIGVALITSTTGIIIASIGAWASTERATRPLHERIEKLEKALKKKGVDPDEVS